MNVKSTDPIKKPLVAAIRAAWPEVSKVTNVTVTAQGVYRARVLRFVPGKHRSYTLIGEVRATGDGSESYPFQMAMMRAQQ